MDESFIKESLTGFDAVWKRVTGGHETADKAEVYSEEDILKELIQDENCAAQYASSLARMFQGDGRAVLLRHAADAKRHSRRLRAEYFIRTGVSYSQENNCQGVSGKLSSLRQALLQAGLRAEKYDFAAEHTSSLELRQAYQAFAADTRRCAQETRALLIESF